MKIKNIYVICPACHKTGGTELAHQLVALYNDNDLPAKIAYTGVTAEVTPVHPEFQKYVETWISVDHLEDEYGEIIILPETQVDLIEKFHKATIVFWWMSVDFFIDICGFWGTARHFGLLRAINRLRFTKQIKDKTHLARKVDLHVYQSEYARKYIEKEKYGNALPLSDYINDIYLKNDFKKANRDNIVLYNPKKGYRFTKEIIKSFPDFQWVALENMTNDEVLEIMNRSKVYIDFGNHPGKDRFPREAAMSGCCILTGVRGAAGNAVDIPISRKYKFEESRSNIKLIGSEISNCLDNYNSVIDEFLPYREAIKAEKKEFENQALNLVKVLEDMFSK